MARGRHRRTQEGRLGQMSVSRGAMMVTWMTGVPKKVGRSAQEILFFEVVSSGLADDCIWMEREEIEGDPHVSGGWWCHLKGLKKKSKLETSTDSGARLPGFKSWLCHRQVM